MTNGRTTSQGEKRGLALRRLFTTTADAPEDLVAWERRAARIRNEHGEVIFERDSMRCWSIRDEFVGTHLTGKPQRLVVKLARQTDGGQFSMNFISRHDEAVRGISYLADNLSDLPPSI